ncbi:hypothetical protein HK098_004786 [Nowakowskiella sp. JEL0407]|nr:hypothetical protein HK098_004786 [Nowakowskiella sp. JEL0407]
MTDVESLALQEIKINVESDDGVSHGKAKHGVKLKWSELCKTVEQEVQEELKESSGFLQSMGALFNSKKKKMVKKQILFDISGEASPGELIALMGPSGSGKTTLLSILGGRISHSGHITINGSTLNKSMKRHTAYVLQEDIFFDLTVRQQLMFTAQLRLPESLSHQEKLARVDEVLKSLGLTHCADSRISLLSGGEKKRTNIATELLTDPSLILVDEPTSGLDSTSAVRMMRLLKELASTGKTIISSIHQPSSQVFESFDRLILMAGGKMVYYGKAKDAGDYFASHGYPCPPQYNIADHIMDLVQQPEIRDKLVEVFSYPKDLLKKMPTAPKLAGEETDLLVEDKTENLATDELPKFASSFLTQFKVLLHRTALNKRGSIFTWLNCIQAIGLAVICGLIWFRMPQNINYITERLGFVFFIMTFWPLYSIFQGLLAYPAERAIIDRERASGSYRISAYFLAKTMAETPLLIVLPTTFLIITYWMAGLNANAASFFGILFIMILAVSIGEGIGLFIGSVTKDIEFGMVIATISLMTMLLTGGFFVERIPIFLAWIKYLSVFYYAFMACQTFELGYGNLQMECDPNSRFYAFLPTCQTEKYVSGREILDKALKTETNLGFTIGLMVAIWVIFRVAAYVSLRFVKHGDGRS